MRFIGVSFQCQQLNAYILYTHTNTYIPYIYKYTICDQSLIDVSAIVGLSETNNPLQGWNRNRRTKKQKSLKNNSS